MRPAIMDSLSKDYDVSAWRSAWLAQPGMLRLKELAVMFVEAIEEDKAFTMSDSVLEE